MALNKGQSMALYLLLTSNSQLQQDVLSLTLSDAPDADAFLAKLQTLAQTIDPNVTALDPQLKALYLGKPLLDLSSTAVEAALPALPYSGGPCPGVIPGTTVDDQKKVWDFVKQLT